MANKAETVAEELEKIRQNPWGDEFNRLRLNMVSKGVTFSQRELWQDAEDYHRLGYARDEMKEEGIKPPMMKKKKEPPYYEFVQTTNPKRKKEDVAVKKSLPVGEGQAVSIAFAPRFKELDSELQIRLVELTLAQERISTKALAALLEKYGKKLSKSLTGNTTWAVQEKILLQQTKLEKMKGNLISNIVEIVFNPFDTKLPPTTVEKIGFTLNNAVLIVEPAVSVGTNDKENNKQLVISLEEEQAKAVFNRILTAAEKAKPMKE